jgi:signal transduction histidine kinase
MLAFSGGRPMLPGRVDLALVCASAASDAAAILGSNVQLNLDIDGQDVATFGDAKQLQNAVAGILTNAIEACQPQGGDVWLSLGVARAEKAFLSRAVIKDAMAPGTYAALTIRDTGTGMDEDTLKQIFEPFFSTRFVGRGLGLAATLGVVRGHGGAIVVDSAPGAGTTFHVILPLHANEAEDAAAA